MSSVAAYPYQMPLLSKYKFNANGECINAVTNGRPRLVDRGTRTSVYHLECDDGTRGAISIKEIMQYIKHIRAMQQFNPLNYSHFVVYRPVIKRTRAKAEKIF